jgi:hypothetical protein
MAAPSILQVVSGFKPSVDGVGDFARLLSESLWRDHGIHTHFLICKKPAQPLDFAEIAPSSASYSDERTPESYLEALRDLRKAGTFHAALLHYSPYGYTPKGTPGAFARSMVEFSKEMALHVFFHETWAEGPPWRRSFWTKREQMAAARLLMNNCRSSFTSTDLYRNRLLGVSSASADLTRVPIFSNMGEPAHVASIAERERRLVVFGQLATRLHVYRWREVLEDLCRKLKIVSIADVGSGTDADIPDKLAGIEVTRYGRLPEPEVSNLLNTSLAGAVEYSPEFWAKSGVIAAYAAHGIVPVYFSETGKFAPKLDTPFIDVRDLLAQSPGDEPIPDSILQDVAHRTHTLYRERYSIARAADLVAAKIIR